MRVFIVLLAICSPLLAQPDPKKSNTDEETLARLKAAGFQAAREGDLKTLEESVRAGLPLNAVNARGDTLLIVAAYNGQARAVEFLLKQKGLEIDARNRAGLTALAGAAFKGHLEIARLLVEHKCDMDAASEDGQTPLMFAAMAGKLAVVELLIEKGARIDRKDRSGGTALSLARAGGNEDIVRKLEAALKK